MIFSKGQIRGKIDGKILAINREEANMRQKHRKPRSKEQKWYHSKFCSLFDGISSDGTPITECGHAWSNRCDGETHKCLKLKLRWLASLSEKEKGKQIERF